MRKSILLLIFGLLLMLCLPSEGAVMSQDKAKLISKKPHIDSVKISGNQSFSRNQLMDQMSCREDGFWQSIGLMGENHLTKAKLVNDRAVLDYFYRSRGFIDASTTVDFYGDIEKRTAVVTVDVVEGPRYRVGKVTTGGEVGQLSWQVHLATRRFVTGQYLNYYDIDLVRHDIKAVFANNGYPYAVVDINLNRRPSESTDDIDIEIQRGKLVVFGDVIIDTAKFISPSVSPRVFYKEIAFKKGETYSREKFILSQQRLIRTNLFRYVALKTPQNMTPLDSVMPNFIATGIPRPPKYINLSTGAAQDPQLDLVWDFVGTAGSYNLQGTGRKVQFETSASFGVTVDSIDLIGADFQFGYVEPYLFGIRMPLITTLKFEPGVKSVTHNYRIESIILEATAVREFSLHTTLSLSSSYEQYNIYGVQDLQKFKEEQGISIDRSLIAEVFHDTRPVEGKFNPWRGSYTQYHAEYVGGLLGGDDDFVKLLFSWSRYLQISRKAIFASRLRLAWVSSYGSSKYVPSRERFFLGGAYTIRGFRENSIFPVDSLGVEGGDAIILMNLEIRRPLFWKFWGSLFSDSGINAPSLGLIRWDQTAFSGGAGLQFMSPVGPIRLDYGQRLPVHGIDPGGRFHLSILYAF